MKVGITTGELLTYREQQEQDVADVPASFWGGMGASAGEGFNSSFGPMGYRNIKRAYVEGGGSDSDSEMLFSSADKFVERVYRGYTNPQGPMLTKEEANERFAIGSLTFDGPVSLSRAADLNATQKSMLRRQDIIERSQLGFFPQFVAGLGGAALDPVNVAAGFVPGAILARTGLAAGSMGAATIGSRAAYGAAENAVAAAALTPGTYFLSQAESRPYTVADAFLDVAFGTALGAGLHASIGAFQKWRTKDQPMPAIMQAMENATYEEKVQVVRGAVADVIEGRPVNVGPVVDDAVERYSATRAALDDIDGNVVQISDTARSLGLTVRESGSSLSNSRYLEISGPDGDSVKIRISDHALPPTYLQKNGFPDFTVGNFLGDPDSEPDGNWLDAVRYLSRRFEVDLPPSIRQEVEKQLAEAAAERASFARPAVMSPHPDGAIAAWAGDRWPTKNTTSAKKKRKALRAEYAKANPTAEGGVAGAANEGALAERSAVTDPDTIAAHARYLAGAQPNISESGGRGNMALADVARSKLTPWVDPENQMASRDAAAAIEAADAPIKARTDDQGIGASTPEIREIDKLIEQVNRDMAAMQQLGSLTEADKASLKAADEAVQKAEQDGKVRDLAAICLSGA